MDMDKPGNLVSTRYETGAPGNRRETNTMAEHRNPAADRRRVPKGALKPRGRTEPPGDQRPVFQPQPKSDVSMRKVLVYTFHKAASMFIHRLNTELGKVLQLPICTINDRRYQDEIFEKSWCAAMANHPECAVFGPIRSGEGMPNLPENPGDYSIIIHARDPRDALTSLFFSVAYSHPKVPGRFTPDEEQRNKWIEQGIDSYVLTVKDSWKANYERTIELARATPGCNLVTYEDLVLRYDKWLMQYLMSFKPLVRGGDIRPLFMHCLETFRDEFVILPEDVHRHKRKMLPGDHKEKLAPETIAVLDREFASVLEYFNYPKSA